jgi:hypothetical protein
MSCASRSFTLKVAYVKSQGYFITSPFFNLIIVMIALHTETMPFVTQMAGTCFDKPYSVHKIAEVPIIFTRNGRGAMVLMSLDRYSRMAQMEYVERALDEADLYAQTHDEKMTHEDVFSKVSAKINGKNV